MKPIPADPAALAERLKKGQDQAVRIITAMKSQGVQIQLFGSMADGDITVGSDVDLLVVDCGDLDYEEVMHQIMLQEHEIPIDVVFMNMLPPEFLRKIVDP